jgi:hypothetical protein
VEEVRLAVENVYEPVEVYEEYEYDVTQYDPKRARAASS